MDVTWLGHSCFRIKGKEAVVVTDPCPPTLGYPLRNIQADIVTLSHSHPGHSYVQAVGGDFKKIVGPGEYELKSTFITGISTFHDVEHGAKRGRNTIYLVEMDGITLCHLGDLGHSPSSEIMEQLADGEILFLPVGGVSTVGAAAAAEIVRHLSPKIVVPMHYKTPAFVGDLEPLDRFLKELAVKEVTPQPKLSVNRSGLPASTQVVVLDYPH